MGHKHSAQAHTKVQCIAIFMALLLSILFLLPANVSAVTLDEAAIIYEKWNTSAKRNSYGGASGCAAFTRYMFKSLYGHYDKLDNPNNIVTIYSGLTDVADFATLVKENAVPGDAIRVESDTSSHIFFYLGYDGDNISVYESGITSYADNQARHYTGSFSDFFSNQMYASGTYLIKIIHSIENTGSTCAHTYDEHGVCTQCGEAFDYAPVSVNQYAYFNKDNAAVHDRPYGAATIIGRGFNGTGAQILYAATNCFGNTWYYVRSTHSSGAPMEGWVVYDYLTAPVTLSNVTVQTQGQSLVSSQDAKIHGEIINPDKQWNGGYCGVYIGFSPDSMDRIEEYSPYSFKSIPMWYTLSLDWPGQSIQSGTTIYYQMFVIVDGYEVRGALASFTTT